MNPTETHSHQRPLRIIYADDMRELRELARVSLAREGYSVETVADGRLALERISAAPQAYDLVISDHHMPNLNGLGLVAALRALPFPGKILIFCSELSPAVSDHYRQHGVDRILHKPILPSELRRVLAELFAPAAKT